MGDRTRIEWADASWNPLRGCSRVSEGCRHCYAGIGLARFSAPGQPYAGLAKLVTRPDGSHEARWTGKVELVEHLLEQPLRWRRPRRIFVNSTSDVFHESVPDAWIDRIFAVMALAPQHTFQVLTKRPERMRAYMTDPALYGRVLNAAGPLRAKRPRLGDIGIGNPATSPMSWVWLGVSVEDQATADERIPILLDTPGAIRWISAEPLLGPVDPSPWLSGLDWVVAGGESGPGARPMHPDWARSLRDQCTAAEVPFLFKQWGEWTPGENVESDRKYECMVYFVDHWSPSADDWIAEADDGPILYRCGKRAAGRKLDGATWDQYPEV